MPGKLQDPGEITYATELLGAGVPLQDVQDAMGHADPRTTRRYDRSRNSLNRHATDALATLGTSQPSWSRPDARR